MRQEATRRRVHRRALTPEVNGFRGTLRLRPLPPCFRTYRLLAGIEWRGVAAGLRWRVEVPRGFETDFASVPRVLWWLVPPCGPWAPAALVHDYLYRVEWASVTRAEADAVFRVGMVEGGCGRATAWAMWLAVRLFGGWCWGRCAPEAA